MIIAYPKLQNEKPRKRAELSSNAIRATTTLSNSVKLSEREKQFLKLACSELTYNEVASHMSLSPKTIDNYRISVFEKLHVKSRVGMVLHAVKYGYVQL